MALDLHAQLPQLLDPLADGRTRYPDLGGDLRPRNDDRGVLHQQVDHLIDLAFGASGSHECGLSR